MYTAGNGGGEPTYLNVTDPTNGQKHDKHARPRVFTEYGLLKRPQTIQRLSSGNEPSMRNPHQDRDPVEVASRAQCQIRERLSGKRGGGDG